MRTDQELADGAVRKSSKWKTDEIGGNDDESIDSRLQIGDEMIDGKLVVHSLSGNERNRLFRNNLADGRFQNLSAISGIDSSSDSRGFALLDYDRDGWLDIALVNANQPLTQLFHNDVGSLEIGGGNMIALRFVGGNKTAKPSQFSNRDSYGAKVTLQFADGHSLMREHRCGDGFAAQNSSTMIIGLGEVRVVENLTVRWPSGLVTSAKNLTEGSLVTAFENKEEGSFSSEPYRKNLDLQSEIAKVKFPLAKETKAKVQVFTTMATWCPACLSHLPGLAYLKDEEIALFGIPVDPADTPGLLSNYAATHNPPYQILAGLDETKRKEASDFLARILKRKDLPLPTTVITDSKGGILEVMTGIPTLSQVRRWISEGK